MIASGKVTHTGRAYLGLSAADASTQSALGYYGQQATSSTVSGAVVEQVSVNSPASNAGVEQGDVITSLGGKTVTGEDDLLAAPAAQKPGTTVAVKLERNGTTLTVKVHLSELSAS